MKLSNNQKDGFTIVELLIVVVVIAILAAITIVSYNGIQSRARTTVIQNDVAQAVRKLEVIKISSSSGVYPATQAAAGLQASGSNTLNYYYNSSTQGYCIEVINGTTAFFSMGTGQAVTSGRCMNSGLAGWWTMNDTANDQSGVGNNGTGTNLTSVTGQSGAANTGYLYGGTDSIMTIPTNASLHPESMTIAAWIRPTAWSTNAATNFVSKRNGNNGYFFFYLTSTQTVHLDIAGSANRWNTLYTPPLNQWTHLAITASPNNGRTLYVNGQPYGSSAAQANPIVGNSSELTIGAESGYGYAFNGTMDDTRVYSRVISAGEVQAMFDQGAQ